MFRKSKDINSNNVIANFYSIENNNKMIKALIIAVILMSLVAGMIDSVLTSFNATKEYDIYNGVRLFYALGLVLAGFIADTKSRIYLPLATLCAILLSSICIFFLSEEISYFAGTALMYLYSGFYVIFFTMVVLSLVYSFLGLQIATSENEILFMICYYAYTFVILCFFRNSF